MTSNGRFFEKLSTTRRRTKNEDEYLGILVRLYRGLGSMAATIRGKVNILKPKIVDLMLARGLTKFVSARTEARLIYELKLPNDEKGDALGGELIRLMSEHGVLEGLSDECIQHLVKSKVTTTKTHELTDKAKKLIRSEPALWEEVRELLRLKPKLEVGPTTKKTRAGG